MEQLNAYMANLDNLVQESAKDDKNQYSHPALKNLGAVSVVLLREAIGPVIFRNAEEEITDIEWNGQVHVRAVPNKFKYVERGRGLQVLRYFKAGGAQPQNKTMLRSGQKPSEAFDLNTLVFGDSAMHGNTVLPVKTAVNYSDALSLKPKDECVDETFHNRAAEDGTLYDAANKKNSDNLFNRHFVSPGTLMVQVLSTRGQVLPPEGLEHLLLCIGLAGTYGGQTSVTGTNIRTHIVGIYADRFEREESSPYILLQRLVEDGAAFGTPEEATNALHNILSPAHKVSIPAQTAQAQVVSLLERFESDELRQQYQQAKTQVGGLFDAWFGDGKKEKKSKKAETEALEAEPSLLDVDAEGEA